MSIKVKKQNGEVLEIRFNKKGQAVVGNNTPEQSEKIIREFVEGSDDKLETEKTDHELILDLTKQVHELTGKVNTLLGKIKSFDENDDSDHFQFIRQPWDVIGLTEQEKKEIHRTTEDIIWMTPMCLHVIRWLHQQLNTSSKKRSKFYESILLKVVDFEFWDSKEELEEFLKEIDKDKELSLDSGHY